MLYFILYKNILFRQTELKEPYNIKYNMININNINEII